MNPVLLELGNYELRYYTVIVIVAVILGISIIQKEVKRFNMKTDFVLNMIFWTIIFGLLGSRVYYVIFSWEYFSNNLLEIFQIWKGGLAIHGAILAGILTVFFYCKKYKVRIIRQLDFMVVGLIIGQAIGRWGNFFNSEAHGGATTLEKLQSPFIPNFVVEGMKIDGIYYIPTFYYEFLACLILFIAFLFIRRNKYTKVGTITGLYLVGYGAIRFFIEMSRTDALMLLGFKVAYIVSIAMFIVGGFILMINARKSKFEDLYNDTSNIDNTNVKF